VQPEQPSKIPPVLVAALVADTGAIDPATHKKSLIGVFDRIFSREFPIQRPLALYFRLTDGEGFYPFKIQVLHLGREEALVAQIEGELRLQDRRQSVDFLIQTPPLPLPEPGRYEFRLLASEMHLGGVCIDVVHAGQGTSEDTQ
jgi:hypothetical protein